MIMALFDMGIFLLSLGLLHKVKNKLTQFSFRIFLGLGLGVAYGFLLQITPPNHLLDAITSALDIIGNGYLALLKMLVVPLILTSIIHAILNLGLGNETSIKKMSFFACGILLGMTALSSLIGLVVGSIFSVGSGLTMPAIFAAPSHTYTGFANTLLGMIPTNPIRAMMQENTVAVVIFSVLLGLAARNLDVKDHDKMQVFREFVSSLFAIVKKLANLVLGFTPFGILALMALLILDQGFLMLANMLNFIAAMYVAMAVVIIMHSTILIFLGVSPWEYFKKAYAPLLVAFTTRSSFGTLPVTEETLKEKFKISQTAATFVPSIGAAIGMNACAGVFPAMLVVMTLTIMHQPLTLTMVLMVMFINAIASIGISGIPGTAYIAATVSLTSLNLPYAIVALVQGVDPIVDMGRTATNVNGVLVASLVVDKMTRT